MFAKDIDWELQSNICQLHYFHLSFAEQYGLSAFVTLVKQVSGNINICVS
jgi:hypothetical protein